MMFGLGFQELLVVLCICLLLFGASRLPALGGSLGRAIREFGKAVRELGGPEEPPPGEPGARKPSA